MKRPVVSAPLITQREAVARNPYYRPLYAALRDWVAINGALFHLRSHLLERQKATRDAIAKRPFLRRAAGVSASLIVVDPTIAQLDGWPVQWPLGGHARFGSAYVQAMERLLQTARAWAVVETFEALERMILDSAAEVVRRHPDVVARPAWAKKWPNRASPLRIVRRRSLRDCRQLVRGFRGTDDVLRCVRDFCPAFAVGEWGNVREIRFNDLVRVTAEVRHAIVHARGVVSRRQFEKIGAQNGRALRAFFSGRDTPTGYALALGDKQAEKAVQLLTEYGLLLHKQLTSQDGLPIVFNRVSVRS